MQTTSNLGLKKPEGNDTVNIDDLNYNADILDQEVAKRLVNSGGVPSIQAGLDAEKPAAGTAGRLYVATDTQIIYRDTGSAWQKVGVVKWDDIDGKPSSFTPSIHGNEAHDPDLALASDLDKHLAEDVQHHSFLALVQKHYKNVNLTFNYITQNGEKLVGSIDVSGDITATINYTYNATTNALEQEQISITSPFTKTITTTYSYDVDGDVSNESRVVS